MTESNGFFIRIAFKELRDALAKEETTDVWDGTDNYTQSIAVLTDRLDPDPAGELSDDLDDGVLNFSIDEPEPRRSKLIHEVFKTTILAEQKILDEVSVDTPNDIPNLWYDELSSSTVDEITRLLDFEGRSDLPDSWSAHTLVSDRLAEYADTTGSNSYEIWFPLNLIPKETGALPNTLTVGKTFIAPVSFDDWQDRLSEAVSQSSVDDINGRYSTLSQCIDRQDRPHRSTHSIWKFECDATSLARASRKFRERLDSVIGLLNFIDSNGPRYIIDHSELDDPSPSDQRTLVKPPFYLVFSDEEYIKFGSTTSMNRPPLRLTNDHQQSIERWLEPVQREDIGRPGKKYIESFRAFQSAATTEDPEREFLALWQAIESVVMTEEGDNSKDVLRRCRAFIQQNSSDSENYDTHDVLEYKLFRGRINRLKSRRNSLVHTGADVTIIQKDLALLQYGYWIVLDGVRDLLAEDRTQDEIIGVLDHGYKDHSTISEAISNKKDDRGTLETEISELDVELSGLEFVVKWIGE